MNYKLAKQLKDAGWESLQGVDDYSLEYEANQISLSKLIEACGDEDFELNKSESGAIWTACSQMMKGVGKTPEEAVAKLWLELKHNQKAS